MQLRNGRVLGPHLADLATDADRHAVRLERPDERRQLGRPPVVLALLLIDVRLREVDQRGRVDVDVAVTGVDRQPAGAPDLLGHRFGIGRVLLGVELVMVALDEHGTLPAGCDRPGQHRRRVVDRALERVGLLAAGELEDDRADAGGRRRLVNRSGHVEGLGPKVDRRHGEAAHFAPGTGLVEPLDAGRSGAKLLAGLPDQPLRRRDRGFVGREGRGPGHLADPAVAEGSLVVDDEVLTIEMGAGPERGQQVGGRGRDVGHRWRISCQSGVDAMVPPARDRDAGGRLTDPA